MKLSIRIELRGGDSGRPQDGYGTLSMQEDLEFPAMQFMEVCEVLGQFQALARKIYEKKNT